MKNNSIAIGGLIGGLGGALGAYGGKKLINARVNNMTPEQQRDLKKETLALMRRQ